ncbi:MAG: iron ABC transporter permease [Vicinamibacteria bacterium]|nr:iron ABC transporter permease [Vicinamibacteria bacterium]
MIESRRRGIVLLSLGLALACATLLAIKVGSVSLPPWAVARSVLDRFFPWRLPGAGLDEIGEVILWDVRVPRVLLALLVGGGLAIVGAALQSVFRNPMAEAGLLGVGSGAAFGAVLAFQLGWAAQIFFAAPMAAFVGALGATLLVYALSHLMGRPSLSRLLLTGLAVSAFAGAATAVLLVATDEYRVKTVLFWLAGGLEGRSWAHVQSGAGFIIVGSLALFALSRPLDVLSLGEEEAASLGLRVHLVRLTILGLASLVAGAATAVAGSVPFVGLVAPHALRPLVGPRGRHLLPAAFLAGALLVILADVASRCINTRIDLPLGSLTAFIGAPYFLLALRGSEGRE